MKINMNFKYLRGSVPVEVLVVGVILLVLALLTMTGIRAFQASDRDVRRIEDLKEIQADLKLYFTRWGHYPGDKEGKMDAPSDWASFADAFTSLGIRIPNDLSNAGVYYYAYNENRSAYVLGAKLELYNKILEGPLEIDRVDSLGITGSAPSGIDCSDNNLGYCIGSL